MKSNLYIVVGLIFVIFSCKKGSDKDTLITTKAPPKSFYGCAPAITDAEWYEKDNIAPLLDGYDVIDYPISTSDKLVQRYFNQGLALAYSFNHAEAARSFYYATKLDPNCAMAFWGYAYVLGPNYNAGMEDDNYERAYEAIQTAIQLSKNAAAKEKQLINAMAKRYAKTPPEDRSSLDISYSKAMKALYDQFPNDAEISALYAESIMNLHPWDLYDKQGDPKPWTPEIVTLLETLIEKNPEHPGAHHFYIHAVEASSSPERSNNSAQVFDDGLVSGSGHLLHMPSHTYIRTGEYHKGTLSNIAAVKADSSYVSACHAQGAYPLGYYPHNYHFMAATATLSGNSHWAMIGANKVSEHVHPDIMKEPGWGTLQHYYVIPYYVAVKFQKWEEILDMDLPTYDLNYVQAIKHYAEGMAYLGLDDKENAKIELSELRMLSKDESLKEVTIWDINSVFDLVAIAEKVLAAEIYASEGLIDEGLIRLKRAIVIEDALNYNEPPDWFFSVRHHLGTLQIKAGLYEQAIDTYKKDLENLPHNGWAFHGIVYAYEQLNNEEMAAYMRQHIDETWGHADFEISF